MAAIFRYAPGSSPRTSSPAIRAASRRLSCRLRSESAAPRPPGFCCTSCAGRWSMVDPGRSLLQEIVEVDETEMPFRRKADPTRRPVERPAEEPDSSRKIRVVGAVELSQDGHPRRIRPERIFDRSSKRLRRRRCMASSAEWSSRAPTSSPMARSSARTCRATPTNHGMSTAERPTRSFTGCTSVFSNLK